eukprot:TRINITY_DN20389_c0_g1_i1.p1 TRINITY_DN20389_c0_g1~~TRINITY_DN20389_c0_g1_i1.p1  ORF type:complete len:3992 (+),score=1256.92 TRINITY_DN20389_c0_g1_i1:1387-11976(+)
MEVDLQEDLEKVPGAAVGVTHDMDALRAQHKSFHTLVCEVTENDAVMDEVDAAEAALAARLRELAGLVSDDPTLLKQQLQDLLLALADVQASASMDSLPPHLQQMLRDAKAGTPAAAQAKVDAASDPETYHQLRDAVADILASEAAEHLSASVRETLQRLTAASEPDMDDPDQMRHQIGELVGALAAVQESADGKHLPKHLRQMLENIKAGRPAGAIVHRTLGDDGAFVALDDAAALAEMQEVIASVMKEPPAGGLPEHLMHKLVALSGCGAYLRVECETLQGHLQRCVEKEDPDGLVSAAVPDEEDTVALWTLLKGLQRVAVSVPERDANLPEEMRTRCREAMAGADWERNMAHAAKMQTARMRSMSVSTSLALEADYVQQAFACLVDSPEATQVPEELKARVTELITEDGGLPAVQDELRQLAATLLEVQGLMSLPPDVLRGLRGGQASWKVMRKRHGKDKAVADLRADNAKAALAREQQLRASDARQQALYAVLYSLPPTSIPAEKRKELQAAADIDSRDVDVALLSHLCEEVLRNSVAEKLAPREREALDTEAGPTLDLWKHLVKRLHEEKLNMEAVAAKPPEQVEKRQLQDALAAWLVDPASQDESMAELRAEVEALVVDAEEDPTLADLRRVVAAIKAAPEYQQSPEEMERSLRQCESWKELTADLMEEKKELQKALGRSRSNSVREAVHAVSALQETLKAVLANPGISVSAPLREEIELLLLPLEDSDDRSPQQLLYDLTVAAQTLSLEAGDLSDMHDLQQSLKEGGGSWKNVAKQLFEDKKQLEADVDSARAQHQHLLAELERKQGVEPGDSALDSPSTAMPEAQWVEEKAGLEHTVDELAEKLKAAQQWEVIALRFEDEKKMLERQIESLRRGDENVQKEHLRQLLGDVVRSGAADALPDSQRLHIERLVREGADVGTLLEALATVQGTPVVVDALPDDLWKRIQEAVSESAATLTAEPSPKSFEVPPPVPASAPPTTSASPAQRLLSQPRDLKGSIQQLLAAIGELEAEVDADPAAAAAAELRDVLARAAECEGLPEEMRTNLLALTQMPIPTDPAQAAAHLAELQEAAKAIETESSLPADLRGELHRLAHDTSALELQGQIIGLKSSLLGALGITPTPEMQEFLTPMKSPPANTAHVLSQGTSAHVEQCDKETSTPVQADLHPDKVPPMESTDAAADMESVIAPHAVAGDAAARGDKQKLLAVLSTLLDTGDLPVELAKWVRDILGSGDCGVPRPDLSHLSPPPKPYSEMDSMADLQALLREKERVIHNLEQELDSLSLAGASPAAGPSRRAASHTPMVGFGAGVGVGTLVPPPVLGVEKNTTGGAHARVMALKNVLKDVVACGAGEDLPPMLRTQLQALLARDVSAASSEEQYSTAGSLRAVGEAVLRHCSEKLPPHILRSLVQATQQPPEPSTTTDSRQPSTTSTSYDDWMRGPSPAPSRLPKPPAAKDGELTKGPAGRLAAFENAVRAVLDSSVSRDLTPALHYHLSALVGRHGDSAGAPIGEVCGAYYEASALRMRISELEAKGAELEGHAHRSDAIIDKMRVVAKMPGLSESHRRAIRAAIAGDVAATAANFALAMERETHLDGVLGARSPSGNDLQTQVAELTSALNAVCGLPTFYNLPDPLRTRIHGLVSGMGGRELLSDRQTELQAALAEVHHSPAAELPEWLARKVQRLLQDGGAVQGEALLRQVERLEAKVQRLEGSRLRADGLASTMHDVRDGDGVLPDEGRRAIDEMLREDAAASHKLKTEAEVASTALIRASIAEAGASALASLLRVVERRVHSSDGNVTLLSEASSAASGLCSAPGVVGASMNAVASLTHDALTTVRARGIEHALETINQARNTAEAAANAAAVARSVAAGLALARGRGGMTPEDTDTFANRLYRDTKFLPSEATGPILQLTKELRSVCSVDDLAEDRLLKLARDAVVIAGHGARAIGSGTGSEPRISRRVSAALPPLHVLQQDPALAVDLKARAAELRANGAPPSAVAAIDLVVRMLETGDPSIMYNMPQDLTQLVPPSGLPNLKSLPGQHGFAKTPAATPNATMMFGARPPRSAADSFDTSTLGDLDGEHGVTRADSYNSVELGVAKTLREALRDGGLPAEAKAELGNALDKVPQSTPLQQTTPLGGLPMLNLTVLSDVAQNLLGRADVNEHGKGLLKELANAADHKASRLASGVLSLLRGGNLQHNNPDAARVLRQGLQHADQLLRSTADVALRSLPSLRQGVRDVPSLHLPALLPALDGGLDAVAALAAAELPHGHPAQTALEMAQQTGALEPALEAVLSVPELPRTTARVVQEALVEARVPVPQAESHTGRPALPGMHAAVPEAIRASMVGAPANTVALLKSALAIGKPRVDVLENAIKEACKHVAPASAGRGDLLLMLGGGVQAAAPAAEALKVGRHASVASSAARLGGSLHGEAYEGTLPDEDVVSPTDPVELSAPGVREGIASVLTAHGDEVLPPLRRKLATLSGVMDPQPPPPTCIAEFVEPKQKGETQVVVIEAPGAGEWLSCDVEAPLANNRFRIRVGDLPGHHPAGRFSGKQLAVSDQHLRVVYAPIPKPALQSKVKRNPDQWPYGDVDGGNGKLGTVVDTSETNQITVQWDATRKRTRCRWGHERVFDVLVPVDEVEGSPVGAGGRVRMKGAPQEGVVMGVDGGDFDVRWETSGRVSRHPWWEVVALDPEVMARSEESVKAALRELLLSIEGDTLSGMARMRLEALCGCHGSPMRKVSKDLQELLGLQNPANVSAWTEFPSMPAPPSVSFAVGNPDTSFGRVQAVDSVYNARGMSPAAPSLSASHAESFGDKGAHYDSPHDVHRWCSDAVALVQDVCDGITTARNQEFINVPPELAQRIRAFAAGPAPDFADMRTRMAGSPLRLGGLSREESVTKLHDLFVHPQSESSVLAALREILDSRDLQLAKQIRELAAPYRPDVSTAAGETTTVPLEEGAVVVVPEMGLVSFNEIGTQSDPPAMESKGVHVDLTAPLIKKLDSEREKVRELQAELRSASAAAALSAAGSGTATPLHISPQRSRSSLRTTLASTPALPRPFSVAAPSATGTVGKPAVFHPNPKLCSDPAFVKGDYVDPQVKKDLRDLSLLGKTVSSALQPSLPEGSDWVDEIVAATRADPSMKDLLPENFGREPSGAIRFGTRNVDIVSINEFPAVRVGGGYMMFHEFVKRFADDERKKLVVDRDPQLADPVAMLRQGREMLFVDSNAEKEAELTSLARGPGPAGMARPMSPTRTRRVKDEYSSVDTPGSTPRPEWQGQVGGRLPRKPAVVPKERGAKGSAWGRRGVADAPGQWMGKVAPSLPKPSLPVEEEESDEVAFDEHLNSGDVFEMVSAADSGGEELHRELEQQKHMMEGTLEVLEARLNNILADSPRGSHQGTGRAGLRSPSRRTASPFPTPRPGGVSPSPAASRTGLHPWRDPSPTRTVASSSDEFASLNSPPTSARAASTAHLGRVSRRTDEHGRVSYPLAAHPIYGETAMVDRDTYMQRTGRSDSTGRRSTRPPPHPM